MTLGAERKKIMILVGLLVVVAAVVYLSTRLPAAIRATDRRRREAVPGRRRQSARYRSAIGFAVRSDEEIRVQPSESSGLRRSESAAKPHRIRPPSIRRSAWTCSQSSSR